MIQNFSCFGISRSFRGSSAPTGRTSTRGARAVRSCVPGFCVSFRAAPEGLESSQSLTATLTRHPRASITPSLFLHTRADNAWAALARPWPAASQANPLAGLTFSRRPRLCRRHGTRSNPRWYKSPSSFGSSRPLGVSRMHGVQRSLAGQECRASLSSRLAVLQCQLASSFSLSCCSQQVRARPAPLAGGGWLPQVRSSIGLTLLSPVTAKCQRQS